MSQRTRILIALAAIALVGAAILGLEMLRGRSVIGGSIAGEPTVAPGGIPIYVDGRLVAGFTPADLGQLTEVSFADAAEGVAQEGWLLADILRLHLKTDPGPATEITVSSSSRQKSAVLTWGEVADPANQVMFDLSNRGTLKLVSVMPALDERDEWVQDTDRIDITMVDP